MNQQERRQRAEAIANDDYAAHDYISWRDQHTSFGYGCYGVGYEIDKEALAGLIESALLDAYTEGRREALREAADAAEANGIAAGADELLESDIAKWLRDRASTLDPTTKGQE